MRDFIEVSAVLRRSGTRTGEADADPSTAQSAKQADLNEEVDAAMPKVDDITVSPRDPSTARPRVDARVSQIIAPKHTGRRTTQTRDTTRGGDQKTEGARLEGR